MDVLCTDKTGTLTMDHVILEHALRRRPEGGRRRAGAGVPQQPLPDGPQERDGSRRPRPREKRTTTRTFPTTPRWTRSRSTFERRIMSVVVRTPEGKDRIISKGAPEAIFPRCKNFELDGELSPMEHVLIDELRQEYEQLSRNGFRVLAIASKDVEPQGQPPAYGRDDETRPDPQRIPRVPRPAEGDGGGGHPRAPAARRVREGGDRRQRPGRPEGLHGSRAVHRAHAAGRRRSRR